MTVFKKKKFSPPNFFSPQIYDTFVHVCVLSVNLSKSVHDVFDIEEETNELFQVFIAQSSIVVVS